MSLNKFFAVLTAVTALSTATAFADPPQDDRRPQQHDSMRGDHDAMQGRDSMQGPHRDSMQGPQRDRDSMRGPGNHDRYWRPEYRGFVPRDRVFGELRRHHYMRFDGDPYWYQGRYVVRSFDRQGRRVFVEINPYTGAFIGVVRF